MKHVTQSATTKLTSTSVVLLCLLAAQSVGAQSQVDNDQQAQGLLDDLALKIQVTVAAIEKNETLAGNELPSSYTIDMPAVNKLDLGLKLNVSDPSQGFKVQSVDQNSLADQVGIKSGDLMVTVNHFEVNEANTEVILSELQSLQAGDTLDLMVRRENSLKQFKMKVEENWLPAASISVGRDASETTSSSIVPEPFRGFDNSSSRSINYDVLSAWFGALVVDVGRSDRRSANVGRVQVTAPVGTRIRPKVNDRSLFEGNRFYFEGLEDNQDARNMLEGLKLSLEEIPSVVPLESYSRDEQLAYWLNLYNVTMLNEIVSIYPTRKLEKFLVGDESVLSKKLLTVAGIPLSLNDIQYKILKENYDNNPLIIYGLYQGIIGGPNVRKEAYNGETVYRALELNAIDFINSNRGTSRRSNRHNVLKVSSLYDRNRTYFPEFNKDLSEHLSRYFDGKRSGLAGSNIELKPVIDDWTVTDLWGTFPKSYFSGIGNTIALMQSSESDLAYFGSPAVLAQAAGGLSVFRPDLYDYLLMINEKREDTNKTNAKVGMEELGEAPVEHDSP